MYIKQKLLTKNEWSRPDRKLNAVRAIVLHWTAGPKDTPEGVYNWFEQRKKGKTGYGSAHYCVGMDGGTMQYLPDEEMAYHVGSKTYTDRGREISKYPNNSSIGIEMCPINMEGEFTDDTWNQTVILTAMLLRTHNLTEKDVVTHQEVVGWKDCPRWFVKYPNELIRFKAEVKELLTDGILGMVTAKNLNVRDKPNGRKVGSIPAKLIVKIRGLRNGWIKISHNQGIGWVFGKYLA